jgi:ligand-binding SRPBCC domain-containing protein
MTDHVLERRFWLRRPRSEVFEFFAQPSNLPLVQPPGARLSWLSAPPAGLAAGTVLDFRVRVLGLPVRWRVMVREFDRPYRFVDVQIRGPFARWEHRHRFIEGPPGDAEPLRGAARGTAFAPAGPTGTWVEDRLTYRLPLGALGNLVHVLGVRRQIAGLFDYRERRLREIFPAP